MCGIAAVINKRKSSSVISLKDILKRIEHRGRPGTLGEIGVFTELGVCLGTNRLPIISPYTNKQPAVARSGMVVLVMNAQIFNYRDLIREHKLNLEQIDKKGDAFFLAEFIEKYGVDYVLGKINWEGAFIYLDKRSKEVVFVRDHLGIKPLYYILNKGELLLSSEIKGLVNKLGDKIHSVIPGTVNRYNLKNHQIDMYRWWNIGEKKQNNSLYQLLKDAVELRVPEEHYAVLLSGGLDSSIILSLAKEMHKKITAYTLFTEGSSDLPYARALCDNYDIKLVEVKGEECDILRKNLPNIVNTVESWQWEVINHSAPMDVLFRKIRKDGHKVVLTGEGADELFFGYDFIEQQGVNNKERERIERILNLHKTNCKRLDRMGMAHGLECRVPFLDQRLISMALNYSYKDCVSQSLNKIPLRIIGKKLLPPGFCEREKLSFSKGAGYKYGKDKIVKNVFSLNDDFQYEMRNSEYEYLARYPIEKFLLDIAVNKGYLCADDLLEAGD